MLSVWFIIRLKNSLKSNYLKNGLEYVYMIILKKATYTYLMPTPCESRAT